MVRLRHAAVPLGAFVALLIAAPVSSHNPITTTVVFNREIAAVLNQKCAQCHVADGMAMPLQSYADVRPWAVAIKEEILARRMPPWQAERGYGLFANDVSLTQREQEFLISWIDGGVPPGAGEPPAHQDHSAHWMLGEPDTIYTATPAGAMRFVVETGLPRDEWVRAIDVKPADKRAIRAAFVSVAGTGQYVGGWTPWSSSTELPEGAAFKLPAKATLVIDIHSGSGAPAAPPRLGVYRAKGRPRPVTTLMLAGDKAAPDGRVRAELKLAADQQVIGLRADMSADAGSLEVKARRPDGSIEPLLWIREFRPEWPAPYVLRSPRPLPRGTTLVATGFFKPGVQAPFMRIAVNATTP